MHAQRTLYSLTSIVVMLICLSLLGCGTVMALTRSYATKDNSIKTGMAVATFSQQTTPPLSSYDTLVEKASQTNANLGVGIVTGKSSGEVAYSAGKADEITVTDSGRVMAYVSDVNGEPKPGDLLAPSPLQGILMRAGDGAKGILGALIGDFPTKTAEQVKLKGGGTAKIAAAQVDLDIHPVDKLASDNGIQLFVERLTGRNVSTVQAFVAMAIVTLVLVIAGSIVYVAGASYLTALGRNPLAGTQLRRGFVRVLGLALLTVVMGVVGCWAVLWL